MSHSDGGHLLEKRKKSPDSTRLRADQFYVTKIFTEYRVSTSLLANKPPHKLTLGYSVVVVAWTRF